MAHRLRKRCCTIKESCFVKPIVPLHEPILFNVLSCFVYRDYSRSEITLLSEPMYLTVFH